MWGSGARFARPYLTSPPAAAEHKPLRSAFPLPPPSFAFAFRLFAAGGLAGGLAYLRCFDASWGILARRVGLLLGRCAIAYFLLAVAGVEFPVYA